MSDKPEEQQQPSAARRSQPSFEEILQGAGVTEPKAAPAPKKSAQPTFEEILESARPAPEAPRPSAPPPERKSRPPRPREERKMPVVVHKPVLGAAAAEPAPPAEAARENPPAPPPPDDPGSVFAQPSPEENTDFAALLEESAQQRPGKLRVGQKVSARVAHLGGEVAFLDLGGKGEGIIDLRELRDEKGDLLVHAGETLEGYVLSLGEGNVVVTRSVPKGAGREMVQQALDSKIPIEGLVSGQNKGGLEVDLGGMRGFVPASQIDIRFVEDPSQFVGQRLRFRVTELRGGNAILSRRSLLEEERAALAVELRKKLEVGAQVEGTVTSVRDFGAFVDLGGLEGLVHVSELSHARVVHAQDVVKPGQRVKVQVLRIEPDEKGHEKIALSLRALEQDPWDAARPQLKEGARLQGKVARLQPFGAFVELFPGVDGLVHVSALSDRHVQHPREVVKEGESIWVQVESVDDAQRRVALRRIGEEEAQAPEAAKPAKARRAQVGDVVQATVDKCEAFGVFVHWDGGKGLVPNAELGTPRGSDNRKTLPPGTQFKAQILEIDERGRYRLSRSAAERAENASDYREYQRQMNKRMPPGKGFGTLGDLLRAKLQQTEDE
ncbi:MAG TPA: S1 RNA-binding domain-containing protein [Myxococcales bacterium]|nr:S1 RNA-binding domain-containing protein [Myxococcales bacterium]